MPVLSANGIEIAYDDRGDRRDPAILLIMGLGTQMIAWPESFCDRLAAQRYRVIRFDNRDIGLSTKFEAAPPIDLGAAFKRVLAGQKIDVPYDLNDMAADALGLMDRLQIQKAHVVGASMGGMIAQILAGRHPDRVSSLVSIMSSSGDPGLPPAKPEAMAALLQPRPDGSDREAAIQHSMKVQRAIGSPGFPTTDEDLRARVAAGFDRSYYPTGVSRQFAAILASGPRMDLLRTISVPTLVLHGADDPLVPVEAGKSTASLIAGSTLTIVPGMGHDLASGLIPILVDAIGAHCRATDLQADNTRVAARGQ